MAPVTESREKVLRGGVARKQIHSSEQVIPTKCLNTRVLVSSPPSWMPHTIPWIPPQLGLQVTVPSSNLPKLISATSSHLLSHNGEISYHQRSSLRWLTSPGATMILWKRMKRSLCWNPHPGLIPTTSVFHGLLPARRFDPSGPPDLSAVFLYQALQLAWTRPHS